MSIPKVALDDRILPDEWIAVGKRNCAVNVCVFVSLMTPL